MENEGNGVGRKSKFGVGFWIVFFFAVIKDLSDIFFSITIFLSFFSFLTGIIMNAVLACYFFFIGIKRTPKKVVTFVGSSIIDVIPFASLLPMTTINLVVIRYLENKEQQ